jgi:hypothetical protein
MSSVDTFLDEVASIEHDFPGFQILPKKDSKLCKILNAILLVLTLGTTRFMTDYHTVIGKTMYTAPGWEKMPWLNRWILLRHEGMHLRQAKKIGLGSFWFGWAIWSFAYLFLLPAVWTLRSRWEREAYIETICCSQRYGLRIDREKMIQQFTSSQYFFMWPFREKVERWLDSLGVRD